MGYEPTTVPLIIGRRPYTLHLIDYILQFLNDVIINQN